MVASLDSRVAAPVGFPGLSRMAVESAMFKPLGEKCVAIPYPPFLPFGCGDVGYSSADLRNPGDKDAHLR